MSFCLGLLGTKVDHQPNEIAKRGATMIQSPLNQRDEEVYKYGSLDTEEPNALVLEIEGSLRKSGSRKAVESKGGWR
jgi:hypothetical protein